MKGLSLTLTALWLVMGAQSACAPRGAADSARKGPPPEEQPPATSPIPVPGDGADERAEESAEEKDEKQEDFEDDAAPEPDVDEPPPPASKSKADESRPAKPVSSAEQKRREEIKQQLTDKGLLEILGAKGEGKGGSLADVLADEAEGDLGEALEGRAPGGIGKGRAKQERYPSMEAPEQAAPEASVPVQVWLSEERVSEGVDVEAGPGTGVAEDGRVTMELPDDPARKSWKIDVILTSPGYAPSGGASPMASIELPRSGDSTRALFVLAPLPGKVVKAGGSLKLRATFWYEGRYLASVARQVTIAGAHEEAAKPAVAGKKPTRARDQAAAWPGAGPQGADLTVRVEYDDPESLGDGVVVVASPHFKSPLILGRMSTPESVTAWLEQHYQRFVAATPGRGAKAIGRHAPPPGKERTIPLMRAFGRELYKRYAPETFKKAFWALVKDPAVELHTIQFYSNNPALPWELMRPIDEESGAEADFLGLDYDVARWHVGDGARQLDRPLESLRFEQLVAIAPRYDSGQALPGQKTELAALERVPGFRRLEGRYKAVAEMMRSPPQGVVHFAGHGEVAPSGVGPREYSIRLEDGPLDLMTWRGLAVDTGERHPFFFFNACDVGQAHQFANFVEGWAPAVLDAGASGYIGGLWPLSDAPAATFASRFYDEIAEQAGEPVQVAAILRDVRRLFLETGDPTFLAYVYYGDVNLRFVGPGR